MTHDHARDLAVDGAKASPILGYLITMAAGVDWTTVGAALMALYTLLLVLEKLWKWGVFSGAGRAFRWVGAQLARFRPSPKP
jgi:hypothetical protein